MYSSFTGWHFFIVLGVIVLFALIIAAIVVPIVLLARRSPTTMTPPVAPGPAGPAPLPRDVPTRLRELDELRARGAISDAEYAAQRTRILGEI